MKIKLILFSLVAMLALPMFMIKPDGQPIMTIDDWLPDTKALTSTLQSATNKLRNVSSGLGDSEALLEEEAASAPASRGKMYSWKDESGVMHFSQMPPPSDAQNVKVRDLPGTVNSMQAVRVPKPKAANSGDTQRGVKLAFPSTVPLKDIPKLVNDAKQLQQLADQRGAALDGL